MTDNHTDDIVPAAPPGLYQADRTLEILFPDPASRPTVRWLRKQQALRTVPYRKMGRLVYFDPAEVRRAFDRKVVRAK